MGKITVRKIRRPARKKTVIYTSKKTKPTIKVKTNKPRTTKARRTTNRRKKK